MIDDASNFRSHIGLPHVEDIVIDQGNLFNSISRWVLLPELIVEVELALVDVAVFEVQNDLEVAVEVGAVAVDDRDPLLVELFGVVVSKADGSDSRVNITACVAHDDAETIRMLHAWPQRARCDSLLSGTQPLSEWLCTALGRLLSVFLVDACL